MPTRDQFKELYENCSREWTTQGGVNGTLVTGPNGNTIFLPAAGFRLGEVLDGAGSAGIYWYSRGYFESANLVEFDSDDWDYWYFWEEMRCFGLSVRPVRPR